MVESNMVEIVPAIMEKDFYEAERKVKLVKDYFSWMQVDVTDNALVTGKSFELELLNKMEFEKIILWDIHLMVKEPMNWIEKCLTVGASRIIGQVEAMASPDDFVKRVKDEGLEAGIAFDINTPITDIPKETDVVLLMGRKMGYEPAPMEVEKLTTKIKNLKPADCRIGVDGGANKDNLKILIESGVDIIYITSMLFCGNIKENLRSLNINAD